MSSIPPLPEDWDYILRFRRDPLAPRIARRFLRAVLEERGTADLVDAAELLTSELVTNALRYADGPAAVHVRRNGTSGLYVGVWDTNPDLPAAPADRNVDIEAEHGRGIELVDALADNWGCCPRAPEPFGAGGKTVWFEIAKRWRDA